MTAESEAPGAHSEAGDCIAFFPNGNILNSSARLASYFPEREYFLLPMDKSQFIFNPLKASQ
jgi:hypothetical protein